MFPEPAKIVFVQYLIQAILALVIMLLLRKFFKQYKNDFYLLWSWSWLALFVNMLGSVLSLSSAFLLPLDSLLRLTFSFTTVAASFLQVLWLYSGSLEISQAKKMNRKLVKAISYLIIPVSIVLVMLYCNDSDGGQFRLFYRVGIRSLIAGIAFVLCASLLKRISNIGIGIRFIIFSFLIYGLLQLNYFMASFLDLQGIDYPLELPYFMGSVEILLQAIMGLGMIISVLEVEQYNLRKANSELDTFLYRSSHDLRAPLTTISGIVSAIQVSDDAKQKEELFNAIQGRLEQADNVIRDIISLRKSQKSNLQIELVSIKDDLEKEYETLISPVSNYPSLSIQGEYEAKIYTDRARLQTVFTNLLSNAIKYHDYKQNDPKIIVTIHSKEKGLAIEIFDNGPGIDEKHLDKIFDMFYRASKSSNGTGLGLYLVKDALAAVRGSIEVSSQKGKGTTFSIYLNDFGSNHSLS